MDGCAYRSLRLSTSGLSPSGILLYCRQRYCFVRPVARMASARQSRSYNRRFQLTSERTHRIYLLYPANGDIGAQVLGHEGYFGSYPYQGWVISRTHPASESRGVAKRELLRLSSRCTCSPSDDYTHVHDPWVYQTAASEGLNILFQHLGVNLSTGLRSCPSVGSEQYCTFQHLYRGKLYRSTPIAIHVDVGNEVIEVICDGGRTREWLVGRSP